MDNNNYAWCKALVEERKFAGDSEACPEFSEVDETEFIEIDENSIRLEIFYSLSKFPVSSLPCAISRTFDESVIGHELVRTGKERLG